MRKFTNNFHYGADGNEADNYTPAQRLEGNVSAIEVLAKLFKEGRKATDEEKQTFPWLGTDRPVEQVLFR